MTPYHDIEGRLIWCSGEAEGVPKARHNSKECDDLLGRRLADFLSAVLP